MRGRKNKLKDQWQKPIYSIALCEPYDLYKLDLISKQIQFSMGMILQKDLQGQALYTLFPQLSLVIHVFGESVLKISWINHHHFLRVFRAGSVQIIIQMVWSAPDHLNSCVKWRLFDRFKTNLSVFFCYADQTVLHSGFDPLDGDAIFMITQFVQTFNPYTVLIFNCESSKERCIEVRSTLLSIIRFTKPLIFGSNDWVKCINYCLSAE